MKKRVKPEEEKETIHFLKELIKIPSSQHDGREIYDYVKNYLDEKGLDAEFQKVENPHISYTDFSNLYLKLGNGKGPKIMLNGHLDTVASGEGWFHGPYKAEERDGRIYGVGAADMKGGCAAALGSTLALLERKDQIDGELFLSFVFGEEAPFSLGTDTLLQEYDLSDHDLIIVTEPSPLLAIHDFCTYHKTYHDAKYPVPIVGAEGRIMYELEFFGKSAHASHPSQGINALEAAAKFISKLEEFEIFSHLKMGRGHYCVLNIDGGDQTFTVPSFCKVFLNRQMTLGETTSSCTEEIQKIVDSLNLKTDVRIKKRFSPALELEYKPYIFEQEDYIDRFVDLLVKDVDRPPCKFTTSSVGDFNLFATRTGVPTLVFGPGGGDIHSPNEFVYRDQVIDTTNYLLEFFMEVF